MKNIFIMLVLLLIVSFDISYAQLSKNSWAFGFGFRYPRYVSANITALNSNYGGYLSLQRDFTEHFGLRLKAGYSHLEGEWVDQSLTTITESTGLITGDLDFMVYLFPCEPVSPYLYVGVGGNYRMLTNRQTKSLASNAAGAQYNIGGGIEWRTSPDWRIVSEFGYHATSNSELDGAISNTELNPRDAYWGISVGLLYLFDKGEPSKYCQLYSGITLDDKYLTDYDRIEEMIKRNIPKEVIKEVVVEKPVKSTPADNWVLLGVNFDFDKATLKPESMPILYNSAEILLTHPDIKVEIQGYTDEIGTDSYNIKLSLERAQTVKNFLVAKGIAADRLTTVGLGKSSPIMSNNTAEGRAMNRRIEFKLSK